MSNHTPTIHEFSTGIYIELLPGNRWRSKGFTGGWNNNTFGTTYGQVAIPAALDAAIRNKQFEVRAPEQEAAVVGRVVQRQGDPEIWAVVAVVSNAVDNRARGLPVWRYFCCACTDLTNANLELIRLLGRLDAFNAKYGRLPVFDPQTLSGKQSNLAQIYPANRPLSEPKSAEYQDALNATNTVILPLVLDARTCHSYYQLLSLASTIASVQNRFISWAWNVSEVEQPGAFVAIQMAVGYTLRMRQAAAPAAAIAAGSDVAALAAVLQEFGRDQQVKAETVQKLDDLLQQDPGLKDPEILRQTYRQFGIEANKKDLKIFRLEQLVNPQQIRALTLWPLLDPQMLPEYQRWCGLFPGNTKQGQISSDFHELKRLLPQFPDLEMAVGEDVVWRWWSLFTNRKISGSELARQLTDTNSLFAPAPDVVCQTLGKRLTQVAQDCHLQIRGQLITQSAELVTDPYWTELNNYIRQWFLKKNDAAWLGMTHPLFVPRSSGGSGEYLFSRGWKSWVDLEEGFQKAEEGVRSLGRLERLLNALIPPQAYSELLTFLDVVCNKNDYFSYFQPLQQFLKDALKPATPVNRFELRVRAIGYIFKPIVGGLFVLVLVFVCVGALWQIVSWFLSSLPNTLASVFFVIILWWLWQRPKKDVFVLTVILILSTIALLIHKEPSLETVSTNQTTSSTSSTSPAIETTPSPPPVSSSSTSPNGSPTPVPGILGPFGPVSDKIVSIFKSEDTAVQGSDLPDETINTNRETFSQLKSELRPITRGSDENFLAQKIASQETSINAEDAIFQLSSEQSPQVLFDWIKAFQKASGLEETGKLTIEDPLYRVLKRRTSRDIAIEANDPFWIGTTDELALKRLGFQTVEEFQTEQQLKTDGIGEVTRARFKEVLTTNLKKTIESLDDLRQSIATACDKPVEESDVLIPELTQELTGNTDPIVWNWSEIRKSEVDINNGADVKEFETAIVRYKYLIIQEEQQPPLEPSSTLIKGKDDQQDLDDLELGIRQQIQCLSEVSDPPIQQPINQDSKPSTSGTPIIAPTPETP